MYTITVVSAFLFRKRTAHPYEKLANSGLPLVVEGGDFDPSSAAPVTKSVKQPPYRAVRHVNSKLLLDPFAYGTSKNLLSTLVLGTDEGSQLSALHRVKQSPSVLSGDRSSPFSRRCQKRLLLVPMSSDLRTTQEQPMLKLTAREVKQGNGVNGANVF